MATFQFFFIACGMGAVAVIFFLAGYVKGEADTYQILNENDIAELEED